MEISSRKVFRHISAAPPSFHELIEAQKERFKIFEKQEFRTEITQRRDSAKNKKKKNDTL